MQAAVTAAPDSTDESHSALVGSQRRNSAYTSAANLAVMALAVLTGPILARSLGDSGRGELAAVIVPAQLIIWVLPLGFNHAVAYYSAEEDRTMLLRCMWAWTLFVTGPVALGLSALAPVYLHGHPHASVRALQAAVGAALLLMPSNACFEMALLKRGSTPRVNLLQNIGSLVSAFATVTMALVGHLTLTRALTIFVASNYVQAIITLTITRGWVRPGSDRATMVRMFRFGWKVALFSTSGLVVARLDQLLMVGRVGSAPLGHYAVAANISGLSSPIANGIGQAMFPVVRRGKTAAERSTGAQTALRMTGALSILIAAGMALTSHWLVPLAFGKAFTKAVLPLLILLPGQVMSDIAQVKSVATSATGNPGVATAARVISSLVTIVLILPAIHMYSINGAAVVTTFSNLVFMISVFVGASMRRHQPRHARRH